MDSNTVFFMGQIIDTKMKKLKDRFKTLFGPNLTFVEAVSGISAIEFMPLNLRGESPLFVMVGANFRLASDDQVPDYKKVSESKNNCRTCVILQDEETPLNYGTRSNTPDFFFNIDTNQIFFGKDQ